MLAKNEKKSMDEYIEKLFKETKIKQEIVQSKEYEDWLTAFIDKYEIITDWEDLYLYNKPDDFSEDDVKNIFLLSSYWDYKDTSSHKNAWFDDAQMNININGKEYLFERVAGLGCYVHTISQIKE